MAKTNQTKRKRMSVKLEKHAVGLLNCAKAHAVDPAAIVAIWVTVDEVIESWDQSNTGYRLRLGELIFQLRAAYSRKGNEPTDSRSVRPGSYLAELKKRKIPPTTPGAWVRDYIAHQAKQAGKAALTEREKRAALRASPQARLLVNAVAAKFVHATISTPDAAPREIHVVHDAPAAARYNITSTTTRTEFDLAEFKPGEHDLSVEEAAELQAQAIEDTATEFTELVEQICQLTSEITRLDVGTLGRGGVDVAPVRAAIRSLTAFADALTEATTTPTTAAASPNERRVQ
jgi:hypothetical protein